MWHTGNHLNYTSFGFSIIKNFTTIELIKG